MKACSGIIPEVVLRLCNLFLIVDSAPPSNLRLRLIGTKIKASWTAPRKTVVDYRVFINDEDVNSNGTIVSSVLTTYTTDATFSLGTTVTLHVRATSNHYWSPVVSRSITIYGNLKVMVLKFSFFFSNSQCGFKKNKLYPTFLP